MAFNYIDALRTDIEEKAQQLASGVPESVGMFTIKSANQTIREAAARPNPDNLWLSL